MLKEMQGELWYIKAAEAAKNTGALAEQQTAKAAVVEEPSAVQVDQLSEVAPRPPAAMPSLQDAMAKAEQLKQAKLPREAEEKAAALAQQQAAEVEAEAAALAQQQAAEVEAKAAALAQQQAAEVEAEAAALARQQAAEVEAKAAALAQ